MLSLILEMNEAPLGVARLRQLDILFQIMSALVITLGRNSAITKHIRSSLGWQESTLLALFHVYCMNGEAKAGDVIGPAVWQVVTLLDNLTEMVGEDKLLFAMV